MTVQPKKKKKNTKRNPQKNKNIKIWKKKAESSIIKSLKGGYRNLSKQ